MQLRTVGRSSQVTDAHVSCELLRTMSAPQPYTTSQMSSSLLLCEALGFSPQLLLDDIINIANNAVQDGVNGMEEFLQKWVDERISRDLPLA
jgi:hypothetical protein